MKGQAGTTTLILSARWAHLIDRTYDEREDDAGKEESQSQIDVLQRKTGNEGDQLTKSTTNRRRAALQSVNVQQRNTSCSA